MIKADLHVHSNFSDGSDDLKTLISKIKSAGINIFALTDHDTIRGCKEMIALVPNDMKFIPSAQYDIFYDIKRALRFGRAVTVFHKQPSEQAF